jgi:hypothetical protein
MNRRHLRLTTAILLAVSWTLMGMSCEQRPEPPSAVEVRVAVPTPCQVDEPQCARPAYNAARKTQPGDKKAQLLRAEVIGYEDCLRLYREALAACRKPPEGATP